MLAGGLAVGLAACGQNGEPSSAPRRTPGASPSASAPSASPVRAATPWSQLGSEVDLVRPRSSSYSTLRLTPNPRWDGARPLALVEAKSPDDVATALSFARRYAVPPALRAGGHCYAGWSAGDGRLVIDTRPMTGVAWTGTTVRFGAGLTLAKVYEELAARGRALPAGSCPTVGLAGLTQGGGVGVLTRAYGLTCDHLRSVEVVLASGQTVTASADAHDDLFWALRGGGGGHLGVVTSLTFDTVPAPTLTTAYLTWPATSWTDVVPAWLSWIGAADPQLWSTLKLLGGDVHPSGPSLGATVTWVGPTSAFDDALRPLVSAVAPTGRTDHVRDYLDAMRAYGGSGEREAFAATSHVAYQPPDAASTTALGDLVDRTPAGLHEAGVSIDALGGHVADLAPGDTAFVHRQALATVQYTATYDGTDPSPAQDFVGRLRARMVGTWGDTAYVNYVDASLPDPGTAYFGDNWAWLQQVRTTYDPDGLFTQPQ